MDQLETEEFEQKESYADGEGIPVREASKATDNYVFTLPTYAGGDVSKASRFAS